MPENHDRLIRYLNDAWALEKTLVEDLKKMAGEVDDPQLKTLFEEHSAVTKQHEESLEARIRALGEEPARMKAAVTQAAGKMGGMVQSAHDAYDRTGQDVMKAYAAEHLEIAMYEALGQYASMMGDSETKMLAERHMAQEREAAAKLWPCIASATRRIPRAA